MTTTRGEQLPGEYFAQMMKVASDLGCQLQPNPHNRNQLRGLCPFHEASKLQNLKTLVVNTNSRKFWCTYCNTGGNPITFMAMAWSISAWDARVLAANEENEIRAVRPPYPQEYFGRNEGGVPTPQNSALLTLATRYYGETLMVSYEPLFLMARLGIRPERARETGAGYCKGQGLREYLLERGVSREEIRISPLFNPNTGAEVMNGRLTLSDLDYTGATLWMTSTIPEEMREDNTWNKEMPSTYGIPGMRPFLFNNKTITRPGHRLTLTDDIRLYLLLECNEIPATLITRRYQDGGRPDEFAAQVARTLHERGIQDLTIAVHNRRRSYGIKDNFLECNEQNRETSLYRQEILEVLNDPQGHLEDFKKRSPGPIDGNDTEENPAEAPEDPPGKTPGETGHPGVTEPGLPTSPPPGVPGTPGT